MIVVIGDSITYGQHLDPTQAWPRLLPGDPVLSRGVPGDTTRLGLERFPKDVQEFGPTQVILQFGHNDANRWDTDRGLQRVSPRAFSANLEEMVERCRTFRARPFLCTLTPSRRSEQHAADVARYDRLLRRVADDEGVTIIDVRDVFLRHPEIDDLIMDDGLHLTARGHEVYAEEVQRVLDREAIG